MNEERLNELWDQAVRDQWNIEEVRNVIAAARERNALKRENEWLKSAGYKQGQNIADGHAIEINALKSEIELLKENIRQLTEDRTA